MTGSSEAVLYTHPSQRDEYPSAGRLTRNVEAVYATTRAAAAICHGN
jgi:hypothetical protein